MSCCLRLDETDVLLGSCQIYELVGGFLHERKAHRSHHYRLIRQFAEGVLLCSRFTACRQPQQHFGEFAAQAGFGAGIVEYRLGRLSGFNHRLGIRNGRLGG